MHLNRVVLEGFRSYDRAELRPAPGLTIVAGPNGAGKTNLLEAIHAAITGRSHRAPTDADLVRHGSDFARVRLDLGDDEGRDTARVELTIAPGTGTEPRKQIALNGVPRRATSIGETVRSVLFSPEEMLLLVGSPSERRRFLDAILAQRDRRLGRDLAALARVLAQRNALLRAIRAEEAPAATLALWDEPLLDAGSRLTHARLHLVAELEARMTPLHRRLAPAEERDDAVSLRYVDSLKRSPDASATPTLDEIRAAFAARLADVREKEVWNGATLLGPQRDDLRVLLGGRDVAAHASRGQQRTIILTLKLAETELLAGGAAGAPIVLLDDIFSELDADRAGRALALLLERGQVLVTAAELGGLPTARRRGVPVWHVADGRLIEAPRVA